MDELQRLEGLIANRAKWEEYARALVDIAANSTDSAEHFMVFSSAIESMGSWDGDCFDLIIALTKLSNEQRCGAARKALGE